MCIFEFVKHGSKKVLGIKCSQTFYFIPCFVTVENVQTFEETLSISLLNPFTSQERKLKYREGHGLRSSEDTLNRVT